MRTHAGRFAWAVLGAIVTSVPAFAQQPASPAPVPAAPPVAAAAPVHVSGFDPARFIRIYEEIGPNQRLLLFDSLTSRSTLLRADADSELVISRLEANAGPANVEVLNYSQIAQDPRTQASAPAMCATTRETAARNVRWSSAVQVMREMVGPKARTESAAQD